jgi:beta-glucuronidase
MNTLAYPSRASCLAKICVCLLTLSNLSQHAYAQTAMQNVSGRDHVSLNGQWQAIIDPYDIGASEWATFWKDRKPQGKTDFYEYAFTDALLLKVPGDFNSQHPELNFYEGSVWYKKTFTHKPVSRQRVFLHFGAVNYVCDVYLNGETLGRHQGGFTPFEFEITSKLKTGANAVIVRVNNQRVANGIPGLRYDWHNYGGITRDVNLIHTPTSFIRDYFIQLNKNNALEISGWVQLDGKQREQRVRLRIPDAGIEHTLRTNVEGYARFSFAIAPGALELWSPARPRLYRTEIVAETDRVRDEIGFRSIEARGTDILLNGKPQFLKGVNLHEEIPMEKRRAHSEQDAQRLLNWAKELGCNFVRLAHYPHSEITVRMAERMGLMLWEEMPVYQHIDFVNPKTQATMNTMLTEMIQRDKNRAGVIIWSLSNETTPGLARTAVLKQMATRARELDPTRLISSALNGWRQNGKVVTLNDPLNGSLDVLAINEYFGWYAPWPSTPGDLVWKSNVNKPLIVSEFGAEALYDNHGPADIASSWSEEFQAKFYRDQTAMLEHIAFLRGTCPWVLADFRSPLRLHPQFQNGWNRKGLLSEQGERKKAWYVMKAWYDSRP